MTDLAYTESNNTDLKKQLDLACLSLVELCPNLFKSNTNIPNQVPCFDQRRVVSTMSHIMEQGIQNAKQTESSAK